MVKIKLSGAKGVSAVSPTKTLNPGARLVCADNSGAKELRLVSTIGYKGTRRRMPKAGVGDMIIASVRKGTPEMRNQIVHGIVIRQTKEYRRVNGMRVKFEDNAAVLVTPEVAPQGSEVRGPMAREAAEKWPQIAGIASMVV
ncbi:MAG: 50S ribosomal protein L14 [Hadesarchaea archaeon]|nr:50S ribosomal protein L14 [Hadesarchaea archaeon]